MQAGCSAELARHYAALSTRGRILAEYLWVGGTGAAPLPARGPQTCLPLSSAGAGPSSVSFFWAGCKQALGLRHGAGCSRAAGSNLHSKSRVLDSKPRSVEELQPWHFDGSQTGQAPAAGSAVYLRPRAIYPDPIRGACPGPPAPACASAGRAAAQTPHLETAPVHTRRWPRRRREHPGALRHLHAADGGERHRRTGDAAAPQQQPCAVRARDARRGRLRARVQLRTAVLVAGVQERTAYRCVPRSALRRQAYALVARRVAWLAAGPLGGVASHVQHNTV